MEGILPLPFLGLPARPPLDVSQRSKRWGSSAQRCKRWAALALAGRLSVHEMDGINGWIYRPFFDRPVGGGAFGKKSFQC